MTGHREWCTRRVFRDGLRRCALLSGARVLWQILTIALCGGASPSPAAAEAAADASSCQAGLPQPEYALPQAAPNVRYSKDVRPPGLPFRPSCLGLSIPEVGTFMEVAGTFAFKNSKRELLARIGNVSALLQVRYWSATEHAWRPLFTAATALTARGEPRGDFNAAEMESGQALYLSQRDNRSTNTALYKMRLLENLPGRIILEIENVSPVRWWALTLYDPGELHSVYLIERRSADLWTYYCLTAIGGSHHVLASHESSYINRAVALYRHYTGIPTDSEPPPAP